LLRSWFAEPPPTFELRQPSARWSKGRAPQARRRFKVVEVIDETPTTKTFVLEPVDGMPLRYEAGQHLTLLVDVGGATERRCYSFSSHPEAKPAITVKRVPDGRVSTFLHERVAPGDTLVAHDPSGSFTIPVDPAAERRYALVAGGVGITPLVSLAESVLRSEPGSRVVLVAGNRGVHEIIFRRRLEALGSAFGDRLDVRFALNEAPAGWGGIKGALTGDRVLQAMSGRSFDAWYVCGPEPMMQDVCAKLAASGVPASTIHVERFVYASTGSARIPTRTARIEFAGSGRTITAEPGQTILQAGLAAGVELPYSCTMGGCGACKVRKRSGSVVTSEPNCLSDGEREAGYVLACCSYADDQLVIEAH
jgi:ferredoxin-NADP reductase